MRYAVATVVIVAALGLGGLGGYVLHGQGGMMRNLGGETEDDGWTIVTINSNSVIFSNDTMGNQPPTNGVLSGLRRN